MLAGQGGSKRQALALICFCLLAEVPKTST